MTKMLLRGPKKELMQFSDQGFESFQDHLGVDRARYPLLWHLRAEIYGTISYRSYEYRITKRHYYGLKTWIPYIIKTALISFLKGRSLSLSKQVDLTQHTCFGFLFYGFYDAHYGTLYPLLSELAEDNPVIAWTYALKSEQVKNLQSMKNVTVIQLDSIQYSGSFREILFDAVDAIWQVLKLERIFHLSQEERFAIILKRSELAEIIFNYFKWKRIWCALSPVFPNMAIFVTNEGNIGKALIETARAHRRLRTFHFVHGYCIATYQVTSSTDICVLNEFDRKYLEEKINNDCIIHAVGNPRVEELRKKVGPLRQRFHDEPFHLLFLSDGTEPPYSKEMREEDVSILASSESLRKMFVLRVRPHPRESVQDLIQLFEKLELQVDEWSSGSLSEDLAWSDAVTSSMSTAIIEAAATGRPCYWLNARNDGHDCIKKLRKEGLGLLVKSTEEWRQALLDQFGICITPPALIDEHLLHRLKILPEVTVPWRVRLNIQK